jgi:hypothetical protein
MMSESLARNLYNSHKTPLVGVETTLHFWERFVERFNANPAVLSGLLKEIDKNICLMIFYCVSTGNNQYVLKFNGVKIPMWLYTDGAVKFQLRTIYK